MDNNGGKAGASIDEVVKQKMVIVREGLRVREASPGFNAYCMHYVLGHLVCTVQCDYSRKVHFCLDGLQVVGLVPA